MTKRSGELIELPLFAGLDDLPEPGAPVRANGPDPSLVLGPSQTANSRTEDAGERERALDVTRSWIVEAPAGSGKTGLLIQRYLRLLADDSVNRPEEVMAITFTRAATEEIRERVMDQLAGAAAGTECKGDFGRATRAIAVAALRRDKELGWGLLDAPHRLNVRTIDSVCGELARSLPVSGGGAPGLLPVDDAKPLYREAAQRTLMMLGDDDRPLSEALETLLLHRDGNLPECLEMIAGMLDSRDQWGELVPFGSEALSDEWLEQTVRRRLDRALELVVCKGLTELKQSIPEETLEELTAMARQMALAGEHKGQPSPMTVFADARSSPGETVEDLERWQALVHLLVTKGGGWRSNLGSDLLRFTWDSSHTLPLKGLIASLKDQPGVDEAIDRFRALPPARYPDVQWVVAKALFRVLNRALLELQIVFDQRGECDFVEPALIARSGLRAGAAGERGMDLYQAATGIELRHLLVDEMQDTSTNQYDLLEGLTAGWAHERKTVFLVGDPKQSIYLFRHARVEKFVETMRSGHLGSLPVGCLRLTANFRSQAGLVEEFNRDFERIFPATAGNAAEVPFVRAEPVRAHAVEVGGMRGALWHPSEAGPSKARASAERRMLAQVDAREICRLVRDWQTRPLPPGREEPWRIAVLVRARTDLKEIVAAFQGEDGEGAIPFRAVNVEPLKERREVLDLLALTRALMHPADRAAWWAVLLAPWCGMRLADVHALAGQDAPESKRWTVLALIERHGTELSADGIVRLQRVWPVLNAASEKRGRTRLPELVERTWRSLGGDLYLDPAEKSNALQFLDLLEKLEAESGDLQVADLTTRLDRLYAATAETPGAVDLMTIHGAKGLEWDLVLIPQMGRKPQVSPSRLLEWEELEGHDTDASPVVLAPSKAKGQESEALNAWLRRVRNGRETAERRRNLYVACTRAREALHLFGTANRKADGTIGPESGSLLQAAWKAAEPHFRTPASAGTLLEMPGQPQRSPQYDEPTPGVLDLAAATEPGERALRLIQRLPLTFDPTARFSASSPDPAGVSPPARATFSRPEGSFRARTFGNAVHAFLELASRKLESGASPEALAAEFAGWSARVAAVLRGDGIAPGDLDRETRRVLDAVSGTLQDETGQWLLGQRIAARSEHSLRTSEGGSVRLDRIFRAGPRPLSEGAEFLWIVDYKTGSHGKAGVEEWMADEAARYRGQMEAYARALGEPGVRVGLWFPLLRRLTWWVV